MKKFLIFIFFILISISSSFAVDYSRFDLKDINSVNNAVKVYQEEYKDRKGTKEAEEEYNRFLEFYYNFINIQNTQLLFDFKTYRKSYQKQAQKYAKEYYKYGLNVQFDEGEFFVTKSNKYLYSKFKSYLPKPLSDMIKFERYYDKRRISDARYVMPKSRLRHEIRYYNNFKNKYPQYSADYDIDSIIKSLEEDLKSYPLVHYSSNRKFPIDFFKILDKELEDIDVVPKAIKLFQNEFKDKKGSKEADESYEYDLCFFIKKITEEPNEKIKKDYERYIKFAKYSNYDKTGVGYKDGEIQISYPKIADMLNQKYHKYGYTIYFNDKNDLSVYVSPKYIYEQVGQYLSKPYQEYLEYNFSIEDRNIIKDGVYVISESEIKSILDFYKDFENKYPDGPSVYHEISKYEKALKCYPSADYWCDKYK